MFHPSQLQKARERIAKELARIDNYGSVKIYLCFYDDLLVPDGEYNGEYPCSDKRVELEDIVSLIREIMTGSFVIRHNVQEVGAFPAGLLLGEEQDPVTLYVEVSKVYKMDSFTHTSRCD
jgi:hypothetical protein